MGTTIEDIYREEFEEREAKEQEINDKFEEIVNDRIEDSQAWDIFNYLPINKTNTLEADYQNHLWSSFVHLDGGSEYSRQFAIMPFHLLFMLCLQYKVLRIHKQLKNKYDLAFTMEHPRDGEKELLNPNSVFTLGFLGESKLIDLFTIIGVNHQQIKRIKKLVQFRNDKLAHAKGGIEVDTGSRIDEYLDCLSEVQKFFIELNDEIATKWLNEMGTGDEGINYIEIHLSEEYLCPADMNQSKLSELDKKLNNDPLFTTRPKQ